MPRPPRRPGPLADAREAIEDGLAAGSDRDPLSEPPEAHRPTEFGEGLGGRIAASRVGASGQVCGRELSVTEAHPALLEQQPP